MLYTFRDGVSALAFQSIGFFRGSMEKMDILEMPYKLQNMWDELFSLYFFFTEEMKGLHKEQWTAMINLFWKMNVPSMEHGENLGRTIWLEGSVVVQPEPTWANSLVCDQRGLWWSSLGQLGQFPLCVTREVCGGPAWANLDSFPCVWPEGSVIVVIQPESLGHVLLCEQRSLRWSSLNHVGQISEDRLRCHSDLWALLSSSFPWSLLGWFLSMFSSANLITRTIWDNLRTIHKNEPWQSSPISQMFLWQLPVNILRPDCRKCSGFRKVLPYGEKEQSKEGSPASLC